MPIYNMPALAKVYGVSRDMVQKWRQRNELTEPDEYLNGKPVWYSIPPRPTLKKPGRKPFRV